MFAPSSYSYGDHALNLRHRLADLQRRRAHTRRGTHAYEKLTRAIHDLHAQIAKATHGPMYRHRPSGASASASPASASPSADAATTDASAPEGAEDHDLEVSADVSVDTDVPLFKRPVFWLGVGIVGVAVWKRNDLIAMVKGA